MMKGILGGLALGWIIGMVIIFVPASEIILDEMISSDEIDPQITSAIAYAYPRLILLVILVWLVRMVWPAKKPEDKD